ncbi:MAG: MarR family winged helix-turn-helix transcriptional regulator [Gammaproteobacteria bacterium]
MTDDDRLDHPRQQDDLLLYRLYRIHATAGPLVVRMCERDYGITRREWRVLSCLADVEGVQSSELAERTMLDRARTSRTLTRLVDKALVRREPKPSDRREVHVFLTEEGRRIHAEIFPRIAAIQRELLGPFTFEERRQLSQLLGRLQASARRMNPGNAATTDDPQTRGSDIRV